ncbi:hypothetical protein FJ656_23555 [Schumannella luteola]|nr:hypothetical protein FJ656_23555 [Schumannella luteola]
MPRATARPRPDRAVRDRADARRAWSRGRRPLRRIRRADPCPPASRPRVRREAADPSRPPAPVRMWSEPRAAGRAARRAAGGAVPWP